MVTFTGSRKANLFQLRFFSIILKYLFLLFPVLADVLLTYKGFIENGINIKIFIFVQLIVAIIEIISVRYVFNPDEYRITDDKLIITYIPFFKNVMLISEVFIKRESDSIAKYTALFKYMDRIVIIHSKNYRFIMN